MSSTMPKERYLSKGPSTPAAVTNGSNLRTFHGQSVLVGQLPEDFLRIDSSGRASDEPTSGPPNGPARSQLEIDEQLAASLQQQYDHAAVRRTQWASQYQAQLTITCVEAKLIKNYGLVNMNPFLRLRVGHTIFETKTSHKGGKNPKWNESIRCYLPNGVDTLSIEILDECLLSADDLIAWASFKIPPQHLTFGEDSASQQHTFEENIILSGKQGDEKEGFVVMVFTLKPITSSTMPATGPVVASAMPMYSAPYVYASPHLVHNPAQVLVHQSAEPAAHLLPPAPAPIKEEDIKQLQEMFPKIDLEVIKSVLTSERGNLDRAINNLLELNSTT